MCPRFKYFWQRLCIFSQNLLYRHIFGRIKVVSNKSYTFVIKLVETYSDFLHLTNTLLSSDSECEVSLALQESFRVIPAYPNPNPCVCFRNRFPFSNSSSAHGMICCIVISILLYFRGFFNSSTFLSLLMMVYVLLYQFSQPAPSGTSYAQIYFRPATHSRDRLPFLFAFIFLYSLCTFAKVGAKVIAKTKRENRTLSNKSDRFASIFRFVFSLLTTSTSPCDRFLASVNLPLLPVSQFLMTIVYRCESIIEEGLCRRLHTRGPGQIELILFSVIFVSILENHQHLNGFTEVSTGKQIKKATR